MNYKYTGRKGGAKPSKKRFGTEITGVKTTGLSEKNKKLVLLTETVQDVMRHPERECICRKTGKQWEGCAGMTKGDPCPKMALKLKSIENELREIAAQPDEPDQPEKRTVRLTDGTEYDVTKKGDKINFSTSCGVGLPALDMTPCSPDNKTLLIDRKTLHPIADNTLDYMAYMRQNQSKQANQ
jgi:hypothetical protein